MTDVTCSVVYDYWDLPVLHAEGVAINYNVDPPELYITTDPSSPSGAPYVPILITFHLPKIGTGLMFPDHPNIFQAPVYCDGCDEVWEEIREVEDHFNNQVQHQEIIYGIELTVCMLVIFVPVILISIFVFAKKLQNYDPSSYPSTPQKSNTRADDSSLWGELFSRNKKKEVGKSYLRVPEHNFEDQNF